MHKENNFKAQRRERKKENTTESSETDKVMNNQTRFQLFALQLHPAAFV